MEKTDPFLKTFPFVWVVTLVVGAILFIAVDMAWALSFVLGNVTMMMTMSMLYKNSKKILEQDKQGAQRMAVRNYVFRYFFYAVILIAAAVNQNLEVIGVAIGLFVFKIVFYILLFLERRGE